MNDPTGEVTGALALNRIVLDRAETTIKTAIFCADGRTAIRTCKTSLLRFIDQFIRVEYSFIPVKPAGHAQTNNPLPIFEQVPPFKPRQMKVFF